MSDHAQLLQEIMARESGCSWADLEGILKAIGDDAEMNRRMKAEFSRIPVLTQPEICKYYADSRTWLMQTYNNGHSALLGLARGENPGLPAWAVEFEKYLPPPPQASILDFGGGFMKDSWAFVQRGHRVILAEVEGPVVRIVRSFLKAIQQGGITVVPIRDEQPSLPPFHGIICFETFEHVKNPVLLARRLAQDLPSGAPFVMSVSFGAPEHAPYHLAENAPLGDPNVWNAELRAMNLYPVWEDTSSTRLWRKR